MKKITCTLLAACLLLTGCSGDDESSEQILPQQTDPVVEETVQAPAAQTEESIIAVTVEAESSEQITETVEITIEAAASETTDQVEFDKYAAFVMEYDNSFLGLPQKDKVYIFAGTGNTAELDGMLCHAVSCYDEHEGTLYYMCDFYVSEDGKSVYRYYVSDDRYSLLPETSTFPVMDPSRQAPEEIFAVSNELYGYFTQASLPYYAGMTMEAEVDGAMRTYYMVSDERLDTKNELLTALDGYFAMDIINALMDSSMYREGMDGKLYTLGGDKAQLKENYVGTEYELTVLNGDTAEFTAYTTYSGDGDVLNVTEHVYIAVKSDGRWRFTNYELPY